MRKFPGCRFKKLNRGNPNVRRKPVSIQLIRLLNVSLFFSAQLFAAESIETDEMNQLLDLLNQQTTIATQTQLNSDYVPGMVSIMSGAEMQQRGFSTLWEAMGYLPGVQQDLDSSGKRKLIIRGVGKSSDALKIKIQLNGVSLNQSISAASATLFDTPVNQIEKIEFVRGPGSAIHGEYALMGVLNVITVKQGKSLSAGIDSNHRANMSALYQFGEQTDALHGSFNIALTQEDGEEIIAAEDRTALPATGYAPGPINNKIETISAIFDLSVSGIDLSLLFQQLNRGDFYGVQDYLPPPNRQTVVSDTVYALQILKKISFSQQLSGQLNLTQLVNSSQKNSLFLGVAPIYGGLPNEGDIVSDVDQQERRSTLAFNVKYTLDAHTLFGEISSSTISVESATQFINLDPLLLLPDSKMNAFPSPVIEGDSRKINSMVVQDEFALNDESTLTAGLRYDDVNDEYSYVSPRVAMVWILSSSNILKLQYSEAFRPPSLREAGAATDSKMRPETNQTTEFSYILNSADTLFKTTIYYSEIKDYITQLEAPPFGYKNIGGAELTGLEFELGFAATPFVEINSNLTLQQSKDITTQRELYGSTPVIFTLSSNFQITPRVIINVQLKSLAERVRELGDSRADLNTMNQFDMTLTRNKLFDQAGLNLKAGIMNIFQEKIKYPASMNTYAEDYLVNDDAIFWLALKYDWK